MSDQNIELSRRKVLGAATAIGVAGAGAGLGTSALFSDEEEFANNSIQAGILNLTVTLEIVDASDQFNLATAADNDLGVDDKIVLDGENTTLNGTTQASTDAVTFTLDDLKPGDYWIVCTTVEITGNPGYAQVLVPSADGGEGTNTEPSSMWILIPKTTRGTVRSRKEPPTTTSRTVTSVRK